MTDVVGFTAPGFEGVRVAAGAVDRSRAPWSVAAMQDGRLVADLRGPGTAQDSLFHTWSVIKPVVGTCLVTALHQARLSTATPVADVWPELKAASTGATFTDLLGHALGLVSLPAPGDLAGLCDPTWLPSSLAVAEPDWPAGQWVGEHALTFGALLSEPVRRLTGTSLGEYLRRTVSEPWSVDAHVGLSDAEQTRVVTTIGLDDFWPGYVGLPGTLRHRALGSGGSDHLVNSRAWRRAEVPTVGGHATARAIARFYSLVLIGELSDAPLTAARTGFDQVLGRLVTWSMAGGQLSTSREGVVDWVGMGGLGGQAAGAWPELGLSWCFLTARPGDRRPAEMLAASLLMSSRSSRRRGGNSA